MFWNAVLDLSGEMDYGMEKTVVGGTDGNKKGPRSYLEVPSGRSDRTKGRWG